MFWLLPVVIECVRFRKLGDSGVKLEAHRSVHNGALVLQVERQDAHRTIWQSHTWELFGLFVFIFSSIAFLVTLKTVVETSSFIMCTNAYNISVFAFYIVFIINLVASVLWTSAANSNCSSFSLKWNNSMPDWVPFVHFTSLSGEIHLSSPREQGLRNFGSRVLRSPWSDIGLSLCSVLGICGVSLGHSCTLQVCNGEQYEAQVLASTIVRRSGPWELLLCVCEQNAFSISTSFRGLDVFWNQFDRIINLRDRGSWRDYFSI